MKTGQITWNILNTTFVIEYNFGLIIIQREMLIFIRHWRRSNKNEHYKNHENQSKI